MPGQAGEERYRIEDEDDLLEQVLDWVTQHEYEELNAFLEARPDLSPHMRLAIAGMVFLSNFAIRSDFSGKK